MIRFFDSLSAQVDQYNTGQENAINQFNSTQRNIAEARNAQRDFDLEKFNAQLRAQLEQFNANQDFAFNQFNAQNRAFVENANINYMRQTNTANTAAQNAINMTQTSMAYMVQELRDKADYDFRTGENELSRIAQLVNTALASDPSKYGSSTESIRRLVAIIGGA